MVVLAMTTSSTEHETTFWKAWPVIELWRVQNLQAEKEAYAQRQQVEAYAQRQQALAEFLDEINVDMRIYNACRNHMLLTSETCCVANKSEMWTRTKCQCRFTCMANWETWNPDMGQWVDASKE